MPEKQSEQDKTISEQMRVMFDGAFNAALPKLQKMEKRHSAYQCDIPDEWETYSQIFLPHFRTAVEQALPNAINFLFPRSGMISIDPSVPMPYAQVSNLQNYYEDLIQKKIGLKQNGFLTLKDCMIGNVGYGKVEAQIVTPLDAVQNTIFGGGEQREIRRMDIGAPKEVIKYNYVDWRTVIPMPDGATPAESSGVFHLEGIPENVFTNMYRLDKKKENPELKGDPEAIIKTIRDGKSSLAHFPTWWVLGQFGDTRNVVQNMKKLNDINQRTTASKNSPVIVPVMKYYGKQEHIWLTPDGTIIYHITDKIQTFRCPIVKATSNPYGTEWFPEGDVGSSLDATEGANIFQNSLIDMMSYHLNPATVVNRSIVQDNKVVEPYAQFDAMGKAGDAVSVIAGAQIQPGMLQIGADLKQEIAVANGQPMNLQGGGTAGVMRGGGGAFESFLQTTQARAKMAGAVLQTGWLEDVVNGVITLSQLVGRDDSYGFKDDLTKSFVLKTITADDMRAGFLATVDLDDKFRNTPSERAMDIALYREVYKDNPRIDQDAALEDITGDRDKFKKLRASPEVEAKQRERLQEEAKAREAAKNQQSGGLDPGAQAMQGGASQAGGKQ